MSHNQRPATTQTQHFQIWRDNSVDFNNSDIDFSGLHPRALPASGLQAQGKIRASKMTNKLTIFACFFGTVNISITAVLLFIILPRKPEETSEYTNALIINNILLIILFPILFLFDCYYVKRCNEKSLGPSPTTSTSSFIWQPNVEPRSLHVFTDSKKSSKLDKLKVKPPFISDVPPSDSGYSKKSNKLDKLNDKLNVNPSFISDRYIDLSVKDTPSDPGYSKKSKIIDKLKVNPVSARWDDSVLEQTRQKLFNKHVKENLNFINNDKVINWDKKNNPDEFYDTLLRSKPIATSNTVPPQILPIHSKYYKKYSALYPE